MPYKFLEEVATADIAFEAWGKTLEDIFQSAAEATLNVMIEDLEAVRARQRQEVTLEDEALDMLLFNFLQELIFFKDSQQLLLRPEKVEISRRDRRHHLKAVLAGEKLDPGRHEQRVDVKAVTLHQFSLNRSADGWRAQVILDI